MKTTKLFAQTKSKSEHRYYSTYIEIDENHEIVGWGCTCVYGSFYCWSKKNGQGTKPCWHAEFLMKRYKRARRVTDERKNKSNS